jgi:hypothetical protein
VAASTTAVLKAETCIELTERMQRGGFTPPLGVNQMPASLIVVAVIGLIIMVVFDDDKLSNGS